MTVANTRAERTKYRPRSTTSRNKRFGWIFNVRLISYHLCDVEFSSHWTVPCIYRVSLPDKPRRLLKSYDYYYGYIKGFVNITCEAIAEPSAEFTWKRDDKKMPLISNYHQIFTSENQSVLQVSCTENTLEKNYDSIDSISGRFIWTNRLHWAITFARQKITWAHWRAQSNYWMAQNQLRHNSFNCVAPIRTPWTLISVQGVHQHPI